MRKFEPKKRVEIKKIQKNNNDMFQFMFNGEETKLNNQQQLKIEREREKKTNPYCGFHFSYTSIQMMMSIH